MLRATPLSRSVLARSGASVLCRPANTRWHRTLYFGLLLLSQGSAAISSDAYFGREQAGGGGAGGGQDMSAGDLVSKISYTAKQDMESVKQVGRRLLVAVDQRRVEPCGGCRMLSDAWPLSPPPPLTVSASPLRLCSADGHPGELQAEPHGAELHARPAGRLLKRQLGSAGGAALPHPQQQRSSLSAAHCLPPLARPPTLTRGLIVLCCLCHHPHVCRARVLPPTRRMPATSPCLQARQQARTEQAAAGGKVLL